MREKPIYFYYLLDETVAHLPKEPNAGTGHSGRGAVPFSSGPAPEQRSGRLCLTKLPVPHQLHLSPGSKKVC